MKRSAFFLSFLCVLSLYTSLAYAKSSDGEAAEKKRLEMRKKIEEKKAELNGTSWEIELRSQVGKPTLPLKDTLTFQDQQFVSKNLSAKGFSSTNYTLTIQENGPTVWETMQTSPKGFITFWRGEWLEGSMSGVINRRIEDDKTEEYSFTSSQKASIPPSSKAVEEASSQSPDNSGESSTLQTSSGTEDKKEKSVLLSLDSFSDKKKKK